MKIISKGRGEGKTYDLIELANKEDGYNLIVCHSRGEVLRVWKIILEKKYKLPQPITYIDFINRAYCGMNINNFFIDNVDLLLQSITDVKIGGITVNE